VNIAHYQPLSWILAPFLLGSCSLPFDEASLSYQDAGISFLEAPETVKVGDSVRIDVGTVGSNGCHALDSVNAEVDHSKREVIVRATNRVQGQICTMALVYGQGNTDFTPTVTGTYLIKANNFSPYGPRPDTASATVSIEVVSAD